MQVWSLFLCFAKLTHRPGHVQLFTTKPAKNTSMERWITLYNTFDVTTCNVCSVNCHIKKKIAGFVK